MPFLLFLLFLLYARSIHFGFVYDDHDFIERNPFLTGEHILDFFRKPLWAMSGAQDHTGNVFHPLQLMSYWLESLPFGREPWIFHLVSLLTHVLIVFLIFVWLYRSLGFSRMQATLCSFLFGIHPTVTEVVYFISARNNSLPTLFILLALLSIRGRVNRTLIVPAMFVFAALLSHEIALFVLPVIVWAIWVQSEGTKRSIALFSVFSALLCYLLLRRGAQSSLPLVNFLQTPLYIDWWKLNVRYLELIFFPFDPVGFREYLGEPISIRGLISLLIFGFLVAYTFRQRHLWRRVLPFALLSLPLLFLAASLSMISGVICDRYLYISLLGWIGWIAIVLEGVKIPRAAIALLLIALGTISYFAGSQWRNDYTLWTFALEMNPRSSEAARSLGAIEYQQGNLDRAETLFQQALSLSSPNHRSRRTYLQSLESLAGVASARGDEKKADMYLKQFEDAKSGPIPKTP